MLEIQEGCPAPFVFVFNCYFLNPAPLFSFQSLFINKVRPLPVPRRDQLAEWLQKRNSHPIGELSYLDVGLGSQSIHMEFDGGEESADGGDGCCGPAYTLLVRDSARCKRFFALLTGQLSCLLSVGGGFFQR